MIMKRVFIILTVSYLIISSCDKDDEENITDCSTLTTEESTGTITDIDGNVYNIVTIGTQVWMAENLIVSHYSNGEPILNVEDDKQWKNLTTGAYCNFDNNVTNSTVYGRLYNWYAAGDSRNICPECWHVPTIEEWTILIHFLGGDSIAGGKLKENNTTLWKCPNTGATNVSGFSALPGSFREIDGSFGYLHRNATFWTSTEKNSLTAYKIFLSYIHADVYSFEHYKTRGCSVRCIRD
jgi:uncharacterized protein (TIGR02145 family)